MARNEEKSQSMLNRWLTYKREQSSGKKTGAGKNFVVGQRPNWPGEVNNVADCEKWRMQLVKEIGKKVMDIQNGRSIFLG